MTRLGFNWELLLVRLKGIKEEPKTFNMFLNRLNRRLLKHLNQRLNLKLQHH